MVCAICGERIDPVDEFFYVDYRYICLDCACGLSGYELLRELGFVEQDGQEAE